MILNLCDKYAKKKKKHQEGSKTLFTTLYALLFFKNKAKKINLKL